MRNKAFCSGRAVRALPPLPTRAPRRGGAGFTLPEFIIAMSIGLGVLAATGSAYLFLSQNGRALESQIRFSDKARVLQARFTEIVESSYTLDPDGSDEGFTFRRRGQEWDHWIGFVAGADAASSAIVYRPYGKNDPDGQETLCTHVGTAYAVDGEPPPMFEGVAPNAILMNVYIGDAENETDTTGPGRQGLAVSIVGTSRDKGRSL